MNGESKEERQRMSATTQADGTAMTNTKIERKGSVAILTISRPEKHNAPP